MMVAQKKGISTSLEASSHANAHQLQTLYFTEHFHVHARKIEHMYRSAMQDTGAHVLYLCIGFLQFPETQSSKRMFKAPLIHIPVNISHTYTANHQLRYTITYTGDDVVENLALVEKLKQTYNITLPSIPDISATFETDYLANITKKVGALTNFEVHHHVSLAVLNFTNTLIFHDLEPARWQLRIRNTLYQHPIVQTLANPPKSSSTQSLPTPSDTALLPLICEADGSQVRAITDATLRDESMVIVGPPGTGKSQTITNLIGAFLAQGKTVLFVAEKLAALDVVKSRLAQAGLEPFLLELHSDKTNKKSVLESLQHRLHYRPPFEITENHINAFTNAEKQLHQYASFLRQSDTNPLSVTHSELIWQSIQQRTEEQPPITLSNTYIPDITRMTPKTLLTHQTRLQTIQHLFERVDATQLHAFASMRGRSTAHKTFTKLKNTIKSCNNLLHAIINSSSQLLNAHANIPTSTLSDLTPVDIANMAQLCNQVVRFAKHLEMLHNMTASQAHLDNVKQQLVLLKQDRALDAQHTSRITTHFGTAVPFDEKTHHTITTNLAHIAHTIPTYITSTSILATTTYLVELTTQLLECYKHFHATWQKWQMPFHNLISVQHLKLLINIRPLWHNLLPEHCAQLAHVTISSDIHHQLTDLIQQQAQLTHMRAQINKFFHINEELPEIHACVDAINAFNKYPRWYGFLRTEWRRARAFYYRHALSRTTVPTAIMVQHLTDLYEYLTAVQHYLTHPCWSQIHLQPSLHIQFNDIQQSVHYFTDIHKHYAALGYDGVAWFQKDTEQLIQFVRDMHESHTAMYEFVEVWQKCVHIAPRTFESHTSLAQTMQTVTNLHNALHDVDSFLKQYDMKNHDYLQFQTALDEWKHWADHRTRVAQQVHYQHAFGKLFIGINSNVRTIQTLISTADAIYHPTFHSTARTIMQHAFTDQVTFQNFHDIFSTIQQDVRAFDNALTLLGEHVHLHPFFAQTWPIHTYHTVLQRIFTDVQQPQFKDWIAYTAATDTFERYSSISTMSPNTSVYHVPTQSVGTVIDIQPTTWNITLDRDHQHVIVPFHTVVPDDTPHTHIAWLWHIFEQGMGSQSLADTYTRMVIHAVLQSHANKLLSPSIQKQRRAYHKLDRFIIANQGHKIATKIYKPKLPQGIDATRVDQKTEMALLQHLLPQQRPRMPIRQVLSRATRAVQALKPCFMMSPQSIAQFLEPGRISFDVVIMDEASQMTPSDALGAIIRGRQLIVVGDPKQLPPTQFFTQNLHTHSDAEDDAITSESILDMCMQRFTNIQHLQWHYRSQHHSLIAFANHHFYQQQLQVFPSPYQATQDLGITTYYIDRAVYKDQMNEAEALHIVQCVQSHILTKPNKSLGIVTLNLKQRELIHELIEAQLGERTEFITYVQHWEQQGTPFIIKNLENIQGDERDTIMISTTFGPNQEGNIYQNFGPISRELGWRRLNVLFTRAKQSMILVTSLRPYQIQVNDTTPRGTVAFADYLEYAFHQDAHLENIPTSTLPYHPIATYLQPILAQHGYRVTANLGYSGFAIDLAIHHPTINGAFIAAIITDGPYYQQATTVRDRERLHQETLERMGWNGRIHHIWSNEWYQNPDKALQSLLVFLAELNAQALQQHPIQDTLYSEIAARTLYGKPANNHENDILTRIKGYLY